MALHDCLNILLKNPSGKTNRYKKWCNYVLKAPLEISTTDFNYDLIFCQMYTSVIPCLRNTQLFKTQFAKLFIEQTT